MLVHFDEYKNSLSHKHIDFLKGIYDNAGRTKRSADGERREATNVNCGVVLTGQEMPTADVALFSRVLFLESQRSERTREETDKFHQLIQLRNQCPTNITVELVRYRKNFESRWHQAWERALGEIKSKVDYNIIGERFINNWAMMLATYYCLEPELSAIKDFPFDGKRVYDICKQGLNYQHSLCNSTDEIATFWSRFSKSRQLGDIKEGQDYKISLVNSLKVSQRKSPAKVYDFKNGTYVLFVREKICLAKANIQAKFINGLRYTDTDTIQVVDRVLHDIVNAHLVDYLNNTCHAAATAVSGKNILRCKKIGTTDPETHQPQDLGFVGKVVNVDTPQLEWIIARREIPVIAPLACDQNGGVYNINADMAACEIASEMKVRKLVFLSDVPGVLRDPQDPESLITTIRCNEIDQLIADGVISGGMIPKLNSAREAIQAGVGQVHLIDGRVKHSILLECFTHQGIGTQIVP